MNLNLEMEPEQYIIVDLEATCWPKPHAQTSEIIEIGALRMSREGEVVDEFSQFVKPHLNPVLSEFCINLTSIAQEMVDGAAAFPEVVSTFQSWIREGGETYSLCSWGFYDRKQFSQDCELHELNTDWLHPHMSIKHQYAELNQLARPVGMAAALKREKLSLVGTHHRGIDDARNIARIFKIYSWALGFWEHEVI